MEPEPYPPQAVGKTKGGGIMTAIIIVVVIIGIILAIYFIGKNKTYKNTKKTTERSKLGKNAQGEKAGEREKDRKDSK